LFFLAFIEESGITSWVEMDTVIGHAGGKSILTMDFTFCNFMLGFLLEDKTSLEVTEKLKGSNQDMSERDCASASSFR